MDFDMQISITEKKAANSKYSTNTLGLVNLTELNSWDNMVDDLQQNSYQTSMK